MYYIIFVIIFYLLYYWYTYYKNRKEESIHINFLSKDDLLTILIKDEDKYYEKFYKKDFDVRNSNNIEEYKKLIKESVIDITEEEKNKLIQMINEVENKILNVKLKWFDPIKFNKIKWNIGFVYGKKYEYGLSHTRNNVIILSKETLIEKDRQDLLRTLVHEKVHIYQKIYKQDVNEYLQMNNFKKIRKRNENDMIRTNPDTDEWIYSDKKNNEYTAIYEKNSENIRDVVYSPCYEQICEHPIAPLSFLIAENLRTEKYFNSLSICSLRSIRSSKLI